MALVYLKEKDSDKPVYMLWKTGTFWTGWITSSVKQNDVKW
jgi:hypothetical protein